MQVIWLVYEYKNSRAYAGTYFFACLTSNV